MVRGLAGYFLAVAVVALEVASATERSDSPYTIPVAVETERGEHLGCRVGVRVAVLIGGRPHSEALIEEQKADSIGVAIVVTRGGAFAELAHRIANGLVTPRDSCVAIVAAQKYRPAVQIDQATEDWVGTTDSVPSPSESSGLHLGPTRCAQTIARNTEAAKSGTGRFGGRECFQSGLTKALGSLKKGPFRSKLVLVVAPVNENHDKLDSGRLIRQFLDSGVSIHAMYLESLSKGIEQHRRELQGLVAGTGGSFWSVNDAREGYAAAQEVLSRVRNQCVARGLLPAKTRMEQISISPLDPGVRIRVAGGKSTQKVQ